MAGQRFSLVDVTFAAVPGVGCGERLTQGHRLAEALYHAGVETVEVGNIIEPDRFELAHSLGYRVRNLSVLAQVPMRRPELIRAREALKTGAHPRIHLIVPTAQEALPAMELESYTELLARVESYIALGNRLGLTVDLLLEDAATTDPIFLGRLARWAVERGAAGVTLVEPGQMTCDLFTGLARRVARAISGKRVGVRCHDVRGDAVETSLQAIEAGATEVSVTGMAWTPSLPGPGLDQLSTRGLQGLDAAALPAVQSALQTWLASPPSVLQPTAAARR